MYKAVTIIIAFTFQRAQEAGSSSMFMVEADLLVTKEGIEHWRSPAVSTGGLGWLVKYEIGFSRA